MINKKGRIDLKKYFVKNAIPTEGNFADLIDGMLNQKDDGITKPPGEPLSIEASASGSRSAIKFYESLSDPSAAWVMSLTNALGGKGFSIGGESGTPRLVIDGATGSVTTGGALIAAEGISIPVGRDLSAGGAITASGAITANGGITVPAARTLTVAGSTSVAALTASGTITANGGLSIPVGQNLAVGGTLTATGAISANGGLTIPAGQSLTAGGAVTVSGAITATGAITANGGITVPVAKTLTVAGSTSVAALTASGAITANGGLTIPAGQSLTVGGTIAATGAISADGGLTVPSTKTLTVAGSTSVAALTASGTITANGGLSIPVGQNLAVGGTLTATGAISANGGLTIPTGQTLNAGGAITVSGAITANGGITVPSSKTLTVAGSTNVAALAASGTITASGAITANAGITVPSPNGLNLGKFTWLQLNDRATLNVAVVGDALTVASTGHVYVGSPSFENLYGFEVAGPMRIRGTFADERAGIWLKHLYYNSSTASELASTAFIGLSSYNVVTMDNALSQTKFTFNTASGDLSIAGANAWKVGGGSWSNSSDYRLKDEIRDLTGALDRLLRLRGVTFKWKAPETQGNQTGTQIGMIAQEVETVFPEWISDDPNGYKGITIRGFEALVVEALRELRSELRALRGQPPERPPRAFVPPKDMELKPKRRGAIEGKLLETYDYTDEKNTLLFQIMRFEPKAFRPRRPDGKGGWTGNIRGVRPVLYRLPEVIDAEKVLVLEGEKDVNTAIKLGLPDKAWAATTSPGTVDWRSSYSETLRNKHVVICPDNDRPGQLHLRRIVLDMEGKAASIRLAKLPAGVKDLSDWVKAGATKAQLTALLQEAQPIDSKSLPPLP